MDKKTELLAWLDELGAKYTLYEHPAAFTMQDIFACGMQEKALIAKNLFLRDHKGKRHFLIMVAGDKKVDLRQFGEALGTRVSFASAERLERYLHLAKGEVTPLGLYYDDSRSVEVYLDSDLAGRQDIGVHPGVNTATAVMDFETLRAIIAQRAKSCALLDIPG